MKFPIKTFEPNEVGRDFVIGDLHGAMPCFRKLLEGLEFDSSKDRMFSTADLVDRGPDSLECLELLKNDWFHAIAANHEQMMLECFTGGYVGVFWPQNGGAWGMQAIADAHRLLGGETIDAESFRLFEVLPLAEELPYLITVKMKDGRKFHIIHAEFPPGETITDEILTDPVAVHRLATVETRHGEHILWGRFLFQQFNDIELSNLEKIKRTVSYQLKRTTGFFNDALSHIISGHTILQRPMTIIGQTNIDTAAFKACASDAKNHHALTCIELDTWKFFQATPDIFREVTPVTINKSDILGATND